MKKTKPLSKDDLCYEEEVEEDGICDFVPGKIVAQFNFTGDTIPSNEPMLKEQTPIMTKAMDVLPDNTIPKAQPNGITPPIQGEYFVIKKGFTFRKSTVKKLNEIKASNSDINVYLSTIVDEAICRYYDYIFKEKEK